MRALQFDTFGKAVDVLRLVELPEPEPGPGQVRLRLTHRPVNPSDLMTIAGQYGRLPSLPATPGLEATGVVDALGDGVDGLQIGQRVVPLGLGGTWRTWGVIDARRVLPVPDALSDQTAAQMIGNPVTAWVMLEELLDLEPGDWLLQTAAGSTLGRLVIQLARLNGYKTINLVRRPEQVQELLDLGADAAFCTADPDVARQVRALTGKGAHGALEAVGGETGALALSCLAPGGKMIVYGMLSMQPIPLHSGEMLFRGTRIEGFWLSYWFATTPRAQQQAVLMRLVQLMLQEKLVPPVEAEYDLADFRQAILHAETPGNSGKILLTG